ncbi:ABC transporter ATP-binding protein [Alkalibacter saccharofermentans]|uniref:ATP-binding cassette, subfamily B n=1 Tax=Alkalibacter saccharofermentans DSM 14828 TaxID=1120975 RepID=A0A1M4XLW9_9FIRM|nr:ABC transporter ATP-binding protein [Alkalibacter saccharofermentans]SHE94421.1 ATP-binding cassette, subfamily B [Alkalibacter saccharofermentans DSM 14828]
MIRKFSKFYIPHMKLFVADFSSAFFMSVIDLIFPMLVAIIIDDIIPNKNLNMMYMTAGVMLFLYLIRAVLNYIVNYWGHVLGVRIETDMRKDLFNHVQKLSFGYFDKNKTGHIMSRLVNDLFDIAEFAHHGPEDVFITIITIAGSFTIMFIANWQLALIIFALVPIMLYFTIIKNKQMRKVFAEMRIKIADINAQIEDSISGVRVVQSFGNEWYEQKKFDIGNHDYRRTKEESYKIMGEFISGVNLMANLLYLSVIFFGGLFIYYDQITVGVLIQYLLYVGIFIEPIKRIANFVETFQKAASGFYRFDEIMMIEPDIVDKKNAVKIGKLSGELEFRNVGFSYNDKDLVLKGIDLKINPGETVAFVGPSGAGKTTLCSLIPRFYEVDEGEVIVDGKDIRDIKLRDLRDNIGIVQQDVFLFSGTIRENIMYGNTNATKEEVINAAKLANAHDFIMQLPNGYDTYTGERGVMLSGGQKQRISIARIFLKNPPILILDEATSSLDNENEKIIQQSFDRLSKSRTTLVIAHRLATIRSADKIVVLTEAGIEEEGHHEYLYSKNGMYKKLYDAQQLT